MLKRDSNLLSERQSWDALLPALAELGSGNDQELYPQHIGTARCVSLRRDWRPFGGDGRTLTRSFALYFFAARTSAIAAFSAS